MNPDCSQCTSDNPLGDECCNTRPSQMDPPKCSVDLPASLMKEVQAADWLTYVNKKCLPGDGEEGNIGSTGQLCDPCFPSQTEVKAGGYLYCERPNGKKDDIACFTATKPDHMFMCNADDQTRDAYGGWMFKTPGVAPRCTQAAMDWESALNGNNAVERDTWTVDDAAVCFDDGEKDSTGTDYCHDDYCLYPKDSSEEVRLPTGAFTGCSDAIQDAAVDCAGDGAMAKKYRFGCRKTCGLCQAIPASAAAAVIVDEFETCQFVSGPDVKDLTTSGEDCSSQAEQLTCETSYVHRASDKFIALCTWTKPGGSTDVSFAEKGSGAGSGDDTDTAGTTAAPVAPEGCSSGVFYNCKATAEGGGDGAGSGSGSGEETPALTQLRDHREARAEKKRGAKKTRAFGQRSNWQPDQQYKCGTGGQKDTTGTDLCHDDYCMYPTATTDTLRGPWKEFVSCEAEIAGDKTKCDAYGIGDLLKKGCRKSCELCTAKSSNGPIVLKPGPAPAAAANATVPTPTPG